MNNYILELENKLKIVNNNILILNKKINKEKSFKEDKRQLLIYIFKKVIFILLSFLVSGPYPILSIIVIVLSTIKILYYINEYSIELEKNKKHINNLKNRLNMNYILKDKYERNLVLLNNKKTIINNINTLDKITNKPLKKVLRK